MQAYLEDIDRQLDEVPIREISVETQFIEIVEAYDRSENKGLSLSDDDYEHKRLNPFRPINPTGEVSNLAITYKGDFTQ